MAKYPKSLAEAIKAIKKWEGDYCLLNNESGAEISELKRKVEANAQDVREARQQARDAVAIRDSVHKQFEDLKERLHNSEMECARLRGYMERVREDDAVADPLVEIEGPEGKRMVSKRHPTPPMHHHNGSTDEYLYAGINREKRKHWTSY